MLSPFDIAVAITLDHETKKYVNDPADPGGETKFGISRRSYPKMNIAGLTRDDAKKIYRIDYWNKPGLERLAVWAPDLAIKLFDLGVNCGPKTAIRFLQRAVNTVCAGHVAPKRAAIWRQKVARLMGGKPIKVDGILGPITAGVISACPYPAALMSALKGEAYKHYAGLEPLHVPGWLNRLES